MTMPRRRHKYYVTQEVAELVYDILVRDCQVYAYDKFDFVNWFYGCQGYHSICHSGCGPHYVLKTDFKDAVEFGCLSTQWRLDIDFSNCQITKTLAKEAQEKINFLFARNWNETVKRE